jgi:hypothetical protein
LRFIFQSAVRRLTVACAFIAVAIAPHFARADNDDLRKQIEGLKNSIAPFPKSYSSDPALKAALDNLAKTIESVDCDVFTDAIGCNVKRIVEDAAGLNVAVTGKATQADHKALLLKAINSLIDSSENSPAANKADAAGKIDPKNNKPDPNSAATLVANLLKDRLKVAGVDRTKAKLKEALDGLVSAPPPEQDAKVISVYRAYYGDLTGINAYLGRLIRGKLPISPQQSVPFNLDEDQVDDYRDDTRVCSATRAMQAYCQGKPSCWNVTDNSPVRQGSFLCGYEPAPYAGPINKGLVVVYNCVPKKDFDVSISSPKPNTNDKHIVQFRLGETAVIACDEEPEKPAAAPKAGAAQ